MAKKETRHSELASESQNIKAPYELPDGWKWTRLGDFIDIHRGVSYKKDAAHKEKQENDCLIMRGGNIDEGKININADNVYVDKSLVSENQFIKKNDVVIVTSTGSTKVIGRAGISDEDYSDVAFGAFLTLARPNGKADKLFVNQYFQSSIYRERIRQLASGVNINNIRLEYITESPFPLPPTRAEQERIVNRIETMFSKLDQAQEKAQSVLDSFETRKAAILHKAFSGELTANWRKENGVSDESWEEKRINDCCIPRAGYAFDSKKFTTSGFQIIRMGNLYAGELDLSRSPVYYSENDLDDSIKKRALINDGDILITLTGTKYKRDYGYAVRIDNPNSLLVNQRILCLTPKNEIKTNYLLYYLHSNMFRDVFFSNETGGVNQGNVSSKFVESISFRLPTLPEQQEIVRILDAVLEKESRAKEAAQTVLDQIALLKKSILARAFRGEM